jgi:hypothetical protein
MALLLLFEQLDTGSKDSTLFTWHATFRTLKQASQTKSTSKERVKMAPSVFRCYSTMRANHATRISTNATGVALT